MLLLICTDGYHDNINDVLHVTYFSCVVPSSVQKDSFVLPQMSQQVWTQQQQISDVVLHCRL